MPFEEGKAKRITTISAIDGLPIDAGIWKESHDHHMDHRRLHDSVAHRSGILYGFDVFASITRDNTIIIAPGVAIDQKGETIVSREPLALTLTASSVNYIILYFTKLDDTNSVINIDGGKHYTRSVEDRRIECVQSFPPNIPFLELARVIRSSKDHVVKDAALPFDPKRDEINLLYRQVAFPACYADCGVGELSYVGLATPNERPPNRAGLYALIRQGNAAGFHLTFMQPFNLEADAIDPKEPVLLYMAGKQGFQSRTEAELQGLHRFLSRGGTLFGESGGSPEFSAAFMNLAERVGASVQPVQSGNSLLNSHYVFSTIAAGAKTDGELLADLDAGVIFSSLDYGAGWQGDVENSQELSARERIRQATEFGLNIVAFASKRKRLKELARL